MECLIKFLSNKHQRELRNLAQCRSEKYEDEVEQYKKLFMRQLQYAKEKCRNSECEYYDSCAVISKKIVSEELKRIEEFFDSVKDIYILWLDSRAQDSFDKFNGLFDSYEMDGFEADIKSFDIFFKGRVTQEYLTRWDMFHIPFNKRYLVSNQRYSLTGQPIVYLGKSVIDLVEELEVEDLKYFKVSAIQFPKGIRIFDLRNRITDDLFDIYFDMIIGEDPDYHIGKFYKLILSSLCSFARRQNIQKFNFCEEYVIPQLLAQVTKNKKYDGIMYQSTKRFKNISFQGKDNEEEFSYISDYMENIALFTKVDSKHVYDRELYSRINISTPITISMIDDIGIEELNRTVNEIEKDGNQEKITSSNNIIYAFKRNYERMKYHNQKYYETDIGKIHLYHLFEVLHQILIA